MSYRNFTPHPVNVQVDGQNREFPSEGVARVTESQVVVGQHDGIELRRTSYGGIEGLPEPDGKTRFIVSMLVRQANERSPFARADLVSPDSGKNYIRDERGNIKAATGFCV